MIIVASVCLPWGTAKAGFNASSIGHSVVFGDTFASVEIWHDSDNVEIGGWASAAKACNAFGRVFYRRSDEMENGEPARTFLLRRADCDVAERVVVRGTSAKARDALIAQLAVLPPHSTSEGAISLTKLSDRTGSMTREERLADSVSAKLECTD